MLGQFPVNVLREDAHIAEQTSEDTQLLLQELNLLLHPLVVPGQDLNSLLRLLGAGLGLLSGLPHRHVVPLPPPPVLVGVAVDLLLPLGADDGGRQIFGWSSKGFQRGQGRAQIVICTGSRT